MGFVGRSSVELQPGIGVFFTMLFGKVSFLLVGSVMDGLGSPSDSFFRSNHMAIRHDVMALFLATVKSQHKI